MVFWTGALGGFCMYSSTTFERQYVTILGAAQCMGATQVLRVGSQAQRRPSSCELAPVMWTCSGGWLAAAWGAVAVWASDVLGM
jgi:hypothetical protein